MSAIDQVNTFLNLRSVLCLGFRVNGGTSSAGKLSLTDLTAVLAVQARSSYTLFCSGTWLLFSHEVPLSFKLPVSVTTLAILLFGSRFVVEGSFAFTEPSRFEVLHLLLNFFRRNRLTASSVVEDLRGLLLSVM